jgi:hypothetical protein
MCGGFNLPPELNALRFLWGVSDCCFVVPYFVVGERGFSFGSHAVSDNGATAPSRQIRGDDP